MTEEGPGDRARLLADRLGKAGGNVTKREIRSVLLDLADRLDDAEAEQRNLRVVVLRLYGALEALTGGDVARMPPEALESEFQAMARGLLGLARAAVLCPVTGEVADDAGLIAELRDRAALQAEIEQAEGNSGVNRRQEDSPFQRAADRLERILGRDGREAGR